MHGKKLGPEEGQRVDEVTKESMSMELEYKEKEQDVTGDEEAEGKPPP